MLKISEKVVVASRFLLIIYYCCKKHIFIVDRDETGTYQSLSPT